jgi:hypothetical protein
MILPLAENGKIDWPTSNINRGYIIAVNNQITRVILTALKISLIIDIISF